MSTIAEDLEQSMLLTEFYLFGSVLNNKMNPEDIDLLVIYNKEEDIPLIKDAMKDLTSNYPLDITFLNRSEEKQFDFINMQNAMRISEAISALNF
jgi:predicted nucleotidyltransferase